MIEGVIIKKLEQYIDDRGSLAEVFRTDDIDYINPAMCYISVTKQGYVRGSHEHVQQTDCFLFIDLFELHLWDNRPDSVTYKEYMKVMVGGDKKAELAIIPPGVVHGYKCLQDNTGTVINFPDKLYKGQNKQEEVDEIRHEVDPNSPFKIE